MSLDVTLYVEVDTGGNKPRMLELYSRNITHNMGLMASHVDIGYKDYSLYEVLWRPEEIDVLQEPVQGIDIITFLETGLKNLKNNRDNLLQYNPENGWGNYDGLLDFTEAYVDAIKRDPKGFIEVDR